MEFYELVKILFNDHLLASDNTVKLVLRQYEDAKLNGNEYIGLVKRPLEKRKYQAKVFNKGKGKIGLIPIKGALTYEESGWEALCGMCSYENIQGQAEYLIKKEKVKELILELNSGGGQAYGCFETAQQVKRLATENNVKITTYVDGVAYSGGYAWAAIADELIVNPLGRVGSVGVVLPLVNTSERDKKEGIKRIYITSGKSKVPFDEDGNYTAEFIKEAEKSSKIIYDEFVKHVSTNRNIEKQVIIDTEAKTFSAKDALELGLVDKIATKEQFYEYIENLYGENIMTVKIKQELGEDIKTEGNDSLISHLTEQLNTYKVQNTELQGLIDASKSLQSKVDTLTSQVESKDKEVQELNTKISELLAENQKTEYEVRKTKIAELVSVDEVDSIMSIAADLPQEKFDTLVGTLTSKQDKARKEMEEIGNKGEDVNSETNDLAEKIASRVKTDKAH